MKKDTALSAPCGLYCGNCESLNTKCNGCNRVQGKPFWTTQYKVEICPLYGCCVNQKQLEHCGLCDEFPCNIFSSMRDPSLSDAEAEKALQDKKDSLIKRKEAGTKAWLKELR